MLKLSWFLDIKNTVTKPEKRLELELRYLYNRRKQQTNQDGGVKTKENMLKVFQLQ